MRARIRGKGKIEVKKEKSVRKNWKRWALDASAELREVREQLRLANITVETARNGEKDARADVASLSEALTASNIEVLRLTVELEDKAETLQASQAAEVSLRNQNADLAKKTVRLESKVLRLTASSGRIDMARRQLKTKLGLMEREIFTLRRVAAVFAAFQLNGKALHVAVGSYMKLAERMGYDPKELRPAAGAALQTAGIHLNRITFEKKEEVERTRKDLSRAEQLLEDLGKELGISFDSL